MRLINYLSMHFPYQNTPIKTLKFPSIAQFSDTASHNALYPSQTFSYHYKIFSTTCLHSTDDLRTMG